VVSNVQRASRMVMSVDFGMANDTGPEE
jgi:hypothetical protein